MGLVKDIKWVCPGCSNENIAQTYGEWEDTSDVWDWHWISINSLRRINMRLLIWHRLSPLKTVLILSLLSLFLISCGDGKECRTMKQMRLSCQVSEIAKYGDQSWIEESCNKLYPVESCY